ncbi:MAG: phenylacetate-CoA oxygenase subunit PaaI [Chitinophagia bacterium]|nr:phenylacetate-CoA oxygenase subunit PaaI [Chitinophagia bacterium]
MEARHEYLLHLADNALVLGHRNSEWCGHGPELEQDIALTNLSLDLLGQARLLYQHAANGIGEGATEDTLAFLRDASDYRNLILLELPRGDWGLTILRQYLFSEFSLLQYQALQGSTDTQLAAIAAKAIPEVTYHRRWARDWVVRLGDGTEESHTRMESALATLQPHLGELFSPADFERTVTERGIGIDPSTLRSEWTLRVRQTLDEADLAVDLSSLATPSNHTGMDGKLGRHTEDLVRLLAEMQTLQRTYPGNEW